VELLIRTSDREANQRTAAARFDPATGICKSNSDFVSFDRHRLVKRPGIDNWFLVGCTQCQQREPLANLGFTMGMNILRISDVDRHRDCGVRKLLGR
jgi:hypothetical protein